MSQKTFCIAAIALLLSACAQREIRRFPLAPPLWHDDDRADIDQEPEEYFSGLVWDGADQLVFVPTSRFLSMDFAERAANVNALDEVPNSSWYTNRISVRDMTTEELQRGACPEQTLDPSSTWTIVAAKPNGANPGFIITDQQDRGWLIKFDGRNISDERATAADVIGSRIYHAAGYHAPCNVVVYFDPAILRIGEEAMAENESGEEQPMTQAVVDSVIEAAIALPDGRVRAAGSMFVEGVPIGPWTYQGTRRDDPNDIIRHEDRRELRGGRVLAAWINHFDAREQNTLATYVTDNDGRSWVRHYYIDFGDSFGSRWEQDGLSRRFGNSYYFDFADVLADFFSLGTIPRPWIDVSVNGISPMLGYFDAEHFDAATWKAGYPNPAFTREQPDDGAWMARIIARFDEEAVQAMVDTGRISVSEDRAELVRVLMARRRDILEHYLRLVSPLADFRVTGDGTSICMTDLASTTGVLEQSEVRYHASAYIGDWSTPLWSVPMNASGPVAPEDVCFELPDDVPRPSDEIRPETVDNDASRYMVLDIHIVPEVGATRLPPARLHLYDVGERGFILAGIERPHRDRPPNRPRRGMRRTTQLD